LQVYNPNCGPYGPSRYSSVFDGIWEWVQDQDSGFRSFVDVVVDPVVVSAFFILFGTGWGCRACSTCALPGADRPLFCPAVVWMRLQDVRLKRSRRLRQEAHQEMEQLRQDKRFLLAKHSHHQL
jgi:hypothetical protein